MELNEYQRLAMRTDPDDAYNAEDPEQKNALRLMNGLMGLNGEAGEAIDIAKKAMFQGHELDIDKLIEELGDNLWYIALCCKAIDIDLETVARRNIEKLLIRYPDGFTSEDSIERRDHDPDGESCVPEMRDEP